MTLGDHDPHVHFHRPQRGGELLVELIEAMGVFLQELAVAYDLLALLVEGIEAITLKMLLKLTSDTRLAFMLVLLCASFVVPVLADTR
ncbi:hypothetical protein [Mycobacteroides abscessus]|uniref:Uncharacterized protein n=1 Tax=Mycobacteroides abscessus TaxID=36809 RepID=A0A0U0ZU37_9MYCO|nr:hypothetical protein [Mycobacteroides abscessus]CPV66667.1 Uncharacterised protein [Mycobacteroides abscessus]